MHHLDEKNGQCVTEMSKDETGLGRWTWILMKEKNGFSTRIITLYIPCRVRNSSLLSTYTQQTRYWRLKGERQCSRSKARKDLLQFISIDKASGDRGFSCWTGMKVCCKGNWRGRCGMKNMVWKTLSETGWTTKNSQRVCESRNK